MRITYFAASFAFALSGCGGAAPMPAAPSGAANAQSAITTKITGEYFSLVDKDSDVAWKNRLTPSTPLGKLTRLYVNGGWLKPDGTGKYTLQFQYPYEKPRMNQLLKSVRAKNPSAQLFIVSGFDDGSMYKSALEHPAYFARSVVSFIRTYGLDGYDCDWENGLEKKAVNRLAAAVRTALDAASKADHKDYLFTMAVWPTPQRGDYNLPKLGRLLNQIEIMSYGAGDELSYDADEYVKGGFPRNKIVGGVETEGDYDGPGGPDTLGATGSIAVKAAYARKNLAGMMAWRLDNDYDVNKKPTYRGAIQLWTSMNPAASADF